METGNTWDTPNELLEKRMKEEGKKKNTLWIKIRKVFKKIFNWISGFLMNCIFFPLCALFALCTFVIGYIAVCKYTFSLTESLPVTEIGPAVWMFVAFLSLFGLFLLHVYFDSFLSFYGKLLEKIRVRKEKKK